MEEKLKKIGIQNIQELMKITGKQKRICQAVWYGERSMSYQMAKVIKKRFGIPLDYLLD